MTLDTSIAFLIILLICFIWFRRKSSPEAFIDYKEALGMSSSAPTYTSGASMRIGETRISDLSGDWRTKFGEDEGRWYARQFVRDPEAAYRIANPTYRTATTF